MVRSGFRKEMLVFLDLQDALGLLSRVAYRGMKNAEAQGLVPGSAEYNAFIAKSGSGTTVNMTTSPGSKAMVSAYDKLAGGATTAQTTLGKVDEMLNLLDAGVDTGFGQDLSTKSYLQFTRIQEQQADKFALDIMRKKKIPYDGLERLLTNLSNDERTSDNSLAKYYRSHPFSKVRLQQLKKFKSKIYY